MANQLAELQSPLTNDKLELCKTVLMQYLPQQDILPPTVNNKDRYDIRNMLKEELGNISENRRQRLLLRNTIDAIKMMMGGRRRSRRSRKSRRRKSRRY